MVEAYFDAQPEQQRRALECLRGIVRSELPDAAEEISYGLPTFKVHGRGVIAIGGAKTHVAIYPLSPAIIDAHKDELTGYQLSKGTIRIPLDKQFDERLLRRMVQERLAENKARWPTAKR
jgi:uncharacterized protein YdhG (YjbR/CyaY superfamily)